MKTSTTSLVVFLSAMLLLPFSSFSQNWVTMMEDPNENFYDVQASFEQYWSTRDITERGKGFKAFKRWEHFVGPRVYPSGDRTQMYNAMQNYYSQWLQQQSMESQGPNNPNVQAGNWTYVGPLTQSTGTGAGRVNCVRVDPLVSTTWYVGAPGGGLWKSVNSGSSWTMWNTDGLPAIGVTDIAIDPTNTQVMYLATGDGDAADTYSIGVMKSTNGGTTWNTTGLNWVVTNGRRISKLLIDPSNTQIIHAATSIGMYRTTDGGTNWTLEQAGNFKDAELRPGTPGTVYAVTATQCWRSTDSGNTYASVFTNGSANRLAIAVTAANNQYVYMLAGSAANSGFLAFYRSTNSGASFTQITVSSPTNMLGWASAGNDVGGQSWYDLALAASPTNANECVAGGVNIWRTTNGGTNWTLNGHWTGSGAPYVHADHHDLSYFNGTTVFAGCDGGIFRTTNNGTSWFDLSSGLHIAQMYRLGTSATVNNKSMSGWQDNGTSKNTAGVFLAEIGGDGMECLIDFSNASILYGELYYGNVRKSINDGGTFTTIVNTGGAGVNANGNWVTPYVMHPTNNQILLIGKANLYQSTNGGTTWAALGATTGGSGNFVQVHYARSNPAYIYAIKQNAVFKSTNGGTSFTNVTGSLPLTAAMSYIYTSTVDPNRVYVTYSGYVSGTKVYMSTNGGTSWSNYSTGLPNLPVNCIVYQDATPDGVYAATDVGVYYIDNAQPTWVNFFTGLPNVRVDELEIQYGSGKIRAATYGRGMWESDLFSSGSSAPVADFTTNFQSGCPGICIQFTDISAFSPTAWSWSFQGGTPATSTAQNPLICYNTPGTYSVTLTATNVNGTDTETKTTYITISTAGPLPLVEGFQLATFPPTNWINRDAGMDGLAWARSTATGGYALSTACMWYDNYTLNSSGLRDEMWSPKYDLTPVGTCTMTFDVAYARYDATYSDTLACLVSTDCGQTFTLVWIKGGPTLATAPDLTTAFTPTSTQWRTETVNLNAYAGQATFMVVFQNRGRWGNNLYVDNINLNGTPASGPPTAVITSSGNTICANGCINFTDASTGGPTSWNWTFPSGTPASSTLQNPGNVCWTTAGTYTVTLSASNANGTNTTTQVITVNANPTVTCSPAAPSYCTGGSIGLTASGATTYTWAPATGLSATTGATVTANPTITTTYTITGTNASGCTRTQTVVVTVNAAPTAVVTPASATLCSGGNQILTASGATTYTWAPSTSLSATTGATVTATPTTTITYTVTGTAANGCTDTQTVVITVGTTPTVTSFASSPTICSGQSSTLTANGATTYTWAPATALSATTGASVVATPTTTITYTVTGTTGGCTNTSAVSVTVNATPTVSIAPATVTLCSGGNAVLTASGASTYTWSPATALSATTGASVTASPTVTITYTVTGTAANGCTNTQTRLVTVGTTPTVTCSPANWIQCAGAARTLTASGATTYTWAPATALSATTGAVVTATPTTTITYTVTGTTGGCTNTAIALITVNPNPTVTVAPISQNICVGGNVPMTASGASTYTWSPATALSATTGASVTASPTITTTYTVTGTSVAGCSRTATCLITVFPLPVVNVTPATPTICISGSVSITASGATTYTWAPATGLSATTGTTVNASPTVTTTYTVSGSNGCVGTRTFTVSVVSNPTVTVTPSPVSICPGGSTPLTASGANTYTWAPSTGLSATTGATVTATPTATTTYTVTGTAGGCTNTTAVTVTVFPAPATPTITQLSNVLTCNPAFSSYQWYLNTVLMPGETNQTLTISQAGTYTVMVTDANGCTATSTGFSAIFTGIGEFSLTHFNLFPNPNDGVFQLEMGINGTHDLTIEIMNAVGQLVFTQKLSSFTGNYSQHYDITKFGKGIYTLTVRNEANQSVKKVIVY